MTCVLIYYSALEVECYPADGIICRMQVITFVLFQALAISQGVQVLSPVLFPDQELVYLCAQVHEGVAGG